MVYHKHFLFFLSSGRSSLSWSVLCRHLIFLAGLVVACSGISSASAQALAPGEIVGWGQNSAQQITIPAGLMGVTAIAAGGDHNLALKNDGKVVGWGRSSEGQTSVPEDLSNVVAIAAGGRYSLALKSNGMVVAWGFNNFKQAEIPAGLTGVTAIAAGDVHGLALKNDGMVVAWASTTTESKSRRA
jgi:alpha-tubulin suppressor-like RCC1 family protein